MKIDWKNLIISVIVPILLGAFVGFVSGSGNNYNELIQPTFAPPSILFPIVWTILYALMGISFYIVHYVENSDDGDKIYYLQLAVNLLWSFFFFTFKLYLFSFIWIVLLIILVTLMIKKFYSINKNAAYLQLPYLAWLLFASILNFSIYLLN